MTKTRGWREALRRAADLLSKRGAWTKGDFARDKEGVAVNPHSPKAVCWCASGALQRVATPGAFRKAIEKIHEHIIADPRIGPGALLGFNDRQKSKAPVIRLLRKVAEQG